MLLRKGGEKGGGASNTSHGKTAINHSRLLVDKLQQIIAQEKDIILSLA